YNLRPLRRLPGALARAVAAGDELKRYEDPSPMPATGKVTQVIGSTFDAEFPEDSLPEIYNALKIDATRDGATIRLVGEVQQHLGGGRVRAVALGSTDGLRRGMECADTGSPVTVPVGKETLGRVFNLLGDPIDNRGPISGEG